MKTQKVTLEKEIKRLKKGDNILIFLWKSKYTINCIVICPIKKIVKIPDKHDRHYIIDKYSNIKSI